MLALIVNLALNANNQLQERFTASTAAVTANISGIPTCETDLYIAGRSCIDFVYSPNNDSSINVSKQQQQLWCQQQQQQHTEV